MSDTVDEADRGKPESLALVRDDLVTDRALTEKDLDRLNHEPIAARVLDLVTASDPPVNVALFGAWGSGKSSFSALLGREIDRRGLEIRIVNYNAWTFTGESLERNFISRAATALEVDPESKAGRRYHRGLYENKRSSGLELSKIDLVSLLGLTFVVLVAIIGIISMIVFIAAILAKQDPVAAIQTTIPSVLASSTVTALLVSGVKQILDGARIESGQGAPTQEQLHETFLALAKDETAPKYPGGRPRPILFFIDELDRCPQYQVVETLAAIRNYFEAPGCIFVVAADRQVLERAFESLPYPNPGDAQNPYYGSASEFFDKIFQYQIPLPPLRGATLLRFAHDLVADKPAGVWEILRKASDGHLLDQVLYTLIPSHIRSPRRIKVLLNAFATNARVASARGLPWLPRAQEIAKLTALQTEFPLFANDLIVEPHLPSYLLRPDSAPDARRELVEKHRLDPLPPPVFPEPPPAAPEPPVEVSPRAARLAAEAAAAASPPAESGVTATDPTPGADEDQAEVLKVAQRRLLKAYLHRVSDVPDVGRDLLYLSSAGQAVDLDDPELAALIEERAVDQPTAVIEAAAGRPVRVRQQAIRLLAGQILQGFGLERANLVTALLGIAQGLAYELGASADEATNAVSVVDKQDGLQNVHLVRALGVALSASPTLSEPFVHRLFADPRLLATAQRLAAVAAFADRLDETSRKAVWAALAGMLPTDRTVLGAPLRTLPLDAAQEMVEAAGDAIRLQAGADAAVPDEAPAFVESLLAATDDREDGVQIAGDILSELVVETLTPIYAVLKARVPAILPDLPYPPQAEDLSLAILIDAPVEDWALWTSLLPPVSAEVDGPNFGESSLASLFTRTEGVETVDLEAIVTGVLPSMKRLDSVALWKKLEPALTTAIDARPWASGSQEVQAKVYRSAFALLPLGEPTAAGVERLVAANIALGLEAATVPQALDVVIAVVAALPPGVIDVISPVVAAAVVPAASEPLKARAQIGFAAAMARAGRQDAISAMLPMRDAIAAALVDPKVLPLWLKVPPPSTDVRWMAVHLVTEASPASVPKGTVELFGHWASGTATPEHRTGLLVDVLSATDDVSDWVEATAPHGVDEAAFVQSVAERIESVPTATRRADLARNLSALQPATPRAQQLVAEIMLSLLARKTQADFDTAGRLVRAVGTKHRARPRLSEAFQAGVEANLNLPPGRARELRDSGIVTKRKSSWLDKLMGKKED